MKILKIIALVFLYAVSMQAQMNVGSLMSATSDRVTTTNYFFARPNDLTIIVNVVGFVQRPGRYEIASNIDLVNLISLAGGPMSDGDLNDVKITRIIKDGEKFRRKDIRVDCEDLTTVRAEELVLAPGDVVTIDRTSWSAFRDGFSVVLSAAVLVTAVSQIVLISK